MDSSIYQAIQQPTNKLMLHELYPPLVQEWQVVCLKVAWQLRCSPRSPSDFRARNWKDWNWKYQGAVSKVFCSIHSCHIHTSLLIYIYIHVEHMRIKVHRTEIIHLAALCISLTPLYVFVSGRVLQWAPENTGENPGKTLGLAV